MELEVVRAIGDGDRDELVEEAERLLAFLRPAAERSSVVFVDRIP